MLDISSSSSYAPKPFEAENSLSSFPDKFQRMGEFICLILFLKLHKKGFYYIRTIFYYFSVVALRVIKNCNFICCIIESCFDHLNDSSQSCDTSNFYSQKYTHEENEFDMKESLKDATVNSHVFDEQADSVMRKAEPFSGKLILKTLIAYIFKSQICFNLICVTDEAGCSGLQNLNENMSDSDEDIESEDALSTLLDDSANESNLSDEVVLERQPLVDSQDSYVVPDVTEFLKRKTKIPGKSLTRKRQRHEAEWVSEKAKKAINSGNAGVGKTRAPIVKREMGLGCAQCRFSCHRKITMEQRQTIFLNFWSLADHNRQWDYVARYMTIKKLNDDSNSRRSISNKFSLPISCREIKVCRKMFLDTLGNSFYMYIIYNYFFVTQTRFSRFYSLNRFFSDRRKKTLVYL